ncbi:MAG TPA: phosphopantetheine-binding protein [Anaeromyxobacteraceae bacterium]|nr:phosphopantetheine-binding protein [Anaeromyxobacteraceae bacterium]
MEELEREIKKLIVDSLKLEGVAPEGIEPDAPLFGQGLGLDSIDALELAMALRKRFGVKFEATNAANREIFASVRSLAAFVSSQLEAARTT